MKNDIIAIDLGFGSTKVCYRQETGKIFYEKFTTAIAKVDSSEHITDSNLFEFNGNKYYMFDKALRLNSDSLMDLMSYEGLREASPIIIRYLLKKYEIDPSMIVLGLSLSMINYSKDYKEYISKELNIDKDRIKLVPQGVGAKVTYEKHSLDPINPTSENLVSKNYLGVDIGFNTVDVFKVIDGSVSSQTTEGLEGEGISKASYSLMDTLAKEGINISLQDSKAIITTGKQFYRAQDLDRSEMIQEILLDYIIHLVELVEEKYAESINKMDNILLVGGGAAIIKKYYAGIEEKLLEYYERGFLIIPEIPEYYNVLGYYFIGEKTLNNG